MKKTIKKGYLALIVVAILGVLVIASIGYTNSRVDMANRAKDAKYNEDVDALNAEIVKLGNEKVALADEKDVIEGEKITLETAIADKDTEITELKAEIVELTPAPATAVELGYLIDDLDIGVSFDQIELTDRHLETLFDDEVEFDGKDYDTEERVYLNGTIGANEDDYDGEAYLEIPEGTLVYKYILGADLVNAIEDNDNEDETLTINLLGKDVEISEWDNTSSDAVVTLTSGAEYLFEEGESKEIDGQTVTVTYISDSGTEKIQVKVGDELAVIKLNKMESFNNLDIYVKEILSNEAGEVSPDICTLKIGKDITTEIENDEYYSDDEMYKWVVDEESIGLETAVDYVDLDDDYTPFKAGESLVLPNDFRTITFNGLIETDYQKITIKDDDDSMEIRGNFIDSLDDDYDKVFLNATGFYDKYDNFLAKRLDIEGTESSIEVVNALSDWLRIGETTESSIYTLLDFSRIYDGALPSGNNIEKQDYTYLNNYGITVSDTEDLEEDKDLTVYVPEEKLFGSITVY